MTDHAVIRSDRVFNAMLATDRGIYSRDHPYADSPQSIGEFHTSAGILYWFEYMKQIRKNKIKNAVPFFTHTVFFYKGYKATISAPHMVGQANTSKLVVTVIFNMQ